jgi:SSS family solute:Na+ symporter
VVITDYLQFVILSIGLLVTTALSISHLGWEPIFQTVQSNMGEAGFNPLVEEGGFGVDYVLWMTFLGLVNCALWPTAVARALAMESPQAVKRQYMWSSISFLIRFMIPYFWGICAFVFIVTQAPDLQGLFFPGEGQGEPIDDLYAMPVYLGRILPAGLIGLVAAAMIAAFMSTHDSYLLCWSSVLTQDVIAPLFGGRMSPRGRILLTRILIVLIGVYVFYWGVIYQGDEDIWDYMAITGAVYFTGAFALLVGGLYWKRASSTGACLALVAGLSAVLGLTPVQNLLNLGDVSSARIGLMTVGLASVAMVVGSLLFPDKNPRSTPIPMVTSKNSPEP